MPKKDRIIELSYNNHEEAFVLPINPAEFEFTGGQIGRASCRERV